MPRQAWDVAVDAVVMAHTACYPVIGKGFIHSRLTLALGASIREEPGSCQTE